MFTNNLNCFQCADSVAQNETDAIVQAPSVHENSKPRVRLKEVKSE